MSLSLSFVIYPPVNYMNAPFAFDAWPLIPNSPHSSFPFHFLMSSPIFLFKKCLLLFLRVIFSNFNLCKFIFSSPDSFVRWSVDAVEPIVSRRTGLIRAPQRLLKCGQCSVIICVCFVCVCHPPKARTQCTAGSTCYLICYLSQSNLICSGALL